MINDAGTTTTTTTTNTTTLRLRRRGHGAEEFENSSGTKHEKLCRGGEEAGRGTREGRKADLGIGPES